MGTTPDAACMQSETTSRLWCRLYLGGGHQENCKQMKIAQMKQAKAIYSACDSYGVRPITCFWQRLKGRLGEWEIFIVKKKKSQIRDWWEILVFFLKYIFLILITPQ